MQVLPCRGFWGRDDVGRIMFYLLAKRMRVFFFLLFLLEKNGKRVFSALGDSLWLVTDSLHVVIVIGR